VIRRMQCVFIANVRAAAATAPIWP
jgi:hypothetical protein